MKSDAVKVAELALKQRELEAVIHLLTNPVVLYVAGFAVTEYLQKKGMMGNVAGTLLEGGILAAPLAFKAFDSGTVTQAVKSTGEYAGEAVKSLGELGKSLIPLIGAL